jgi:hypothetical protein
MVPGTRYVLQYSWTAVKREQPGPGSLGRRHQNRAVENVLHFCELLREKPVCLDLIFRLASGVYRWWRGTSVNTLHLDTTRLDSAVKK